MLGYYVYMGTHPVAVLFALYINAMILAVVLLWIMLVAMAWLVQVAAAALRMALL